MVKLTDLPKQTTRTFGGRTFKVDRTFVPHRNISSDDRFQQRLSDNRNIRGKDIRRAEDQMGITEHRDFPVGVQVDGKVLLLDGFGRTWVDQSRDTDGSVIDLVPPDTSEADLTFISCAANCENVSQKGFNKKEIERATLKLAEAGIDDKAIMRATRASSVKVVRDRIERAKRSISASKRKSADSIGGHYPLPSGIKPFNSVPAAHSAAYRLLNELLDNPCNCPAGSSSKKLDALKKYLYDECGVNLRVLVGNNEKQIKGLLFDLRESLESDVPLPTHFLILLYLQVSTATCDSAKRFGAKLQEWEPGLFYFTELSANTKYFDGVGVRDYILRCQEEWLQTWK